MNAPIERAPLRVVEPVLTPAEVAEQPSLDGLLKAAFGVPCPVYPLAVWRRAFRR